MISEPGYQQASGASQVVNHVAFVDEKITDGQDQVVGLVIARYGTHYMRIKLLSSVFE